MPKIILTADLALFTDYSGADPLGFGLCLPCRLVPRLVQYKFLTPLTPVVNNRASSAPYALSKVEAALLASGFKREEVYIVPPHHLRKIIDKDTAIVGVHVVDPMGLAPVSWTLKTLTGGGNTCTHYEFERLMNIIKELKHKFKFKVIVGGPGAWQLRGFEDKYGIDVLLEGEGELTFPKLVKNILDGKEVPRHIFGEPVPLNLIPPIITPSRNGIVQVTRGCPRRCKFCSPTMFNFRSIPLEVVTREAELNLSSGIKAIGFATEDILLYGADILRPNLKAIKKLFSQATKLKLKYGVDGPITFSHVSLSTALVAKEAVKFISDINELGDNKPLFPQVGLESGSPRIVAKYFGGKPYPWKPDEWWYVVISGTKLLNDNYWYPCYTYIIGFPDATPEDYILTIELLDRLREEGFKGWAFPLILIPIGGTIIEKLGHKGFLTLKKLPQEAIEAIVAGWRISIDFSYRVYPKVLQGIKNPLARRITTLLAEKAIDAMREWIDGVRRDPEIIERVYSAVNIRTTGSLIKTLITKAFS